MKLESAKELKLMANTIRADIIRMTAAAKCGHPAGPLGLAEVFSVLFFSEMDFDPKNPQAERDRFVLSNGHVCAGSYSAMAHAGYFPPEQLPTFRKFGSPLQGHPSRKYFPFIDNSSGPLGEGLGIACGYAAALKLDGSSRRVYCVTSDGEHQEGSTWEAVLFAAKYKLDNLIAIMDRNYIQIDGNTEEIMPLGDLAQKYRAFGWHAISVNGHDYKAIMHALEEARKTKGKPTMIIAETTPGKGVSFMENKYQWHGIPPKPEEAGKALAELDEERARIMKEEDGSIQ